MPGLKKSEVELKLFRRKTEAVESLRNVIQHLRNELKGMAEEGYASWGSLSWIAVVDPESRLLASCVIIPGRIQNTLHDILNPAGKDISSQIDHVTLTCKSERVSLTMLYREVERVIRLLEPSLSEHSADQPTLAADLVVRVTCRVEPEPGEEAQQEQ